MSRTPRGISIRRVWTLSTAALLALTVGCGVMLRTQNLRILGAIDGDAERAVALQQSIDGRLNGMLSQEAGLRGFLVTGEPSFLDPYRNGRRDEERWRQELAVSALPEEDRQELQHALLLEARVARRWHDEIAEPQIAARRGGGAIDVGAFLQEGRQRFDDYRAAHGTLRHALERAALNAARRHRAQLVHGNHVAAGVIVLLLVGGAGVSRAIVRCIVRPLAALSDAAERGEVSVDAVRSSRLREVLVLGATLERLFRGVHDRAMRDGLTRAYNRGFLADWLPRQLRLARRNRAPLAALMVDLDHFKRINDSFGHAAGDQVLVALARCIERQLRATDVVVRYGGEEFTVVLPDTAVAGAFVSAERLRAAIAAMTERDGLPAALRVTASIGVAAMAPGDDGARLLPRADAALYEAKRAGRNRVVAAPPPPRGGMEKLAS
jgi:diguanylate cyclase (GGDEF)-like protein